MSLLDGVFPSLPSIHVLDRFIRSSSTGTQKNHQFLPSHLLSCVQNSGARESIAPASQSKTKASRLSFQDIPGQTETINPDTPKTTSDIAIPAISNTERPPQPVTSSASIERRQEYSRKPFPNAPVSDIPTFFDDLPSDIPNAMLNFISLWRPLQVQKVQEKPHCSIKPILIPQDTEITPEHLENILNKAKGSEARIIKLALIKSEAHARAILNAMQKNHKLIVLTNQKKTVKILLKTLKKDGFLSRSIQFKAYQVATEKKQEVMRYELKTNPAGFFKHQNPQSNLEIVLSESLARSLGNKRFTFITEAGQPDVNTIEEAKGRDQPIMPGKTGYFPPSLILTVKDEDWQKLTISSLQGPSDLQLFTYLKYMEFIVDHIDHIVVNI